MERFASGSGQGNNWHTALEACLDNLGPVPHGANLGFVYVTDGLAGELELVVRALEAATEVEQWTGTVGLGVCSNGQEYYDAPAIAVLVGEFPAGAFNVFPTLDTDLTNLIDQYKPWYSRSNQHFVVVHGDPRSPATPDQIPLLAETLPHAYLVGGLSSSQNGHPQYANGVCEGGLSGVMFSQDVSVATALTQGCAPIGRPHVVGDCHQNVIATIDGRPALDVFKEEIGEVLARDLNRVAGYIFVGLPIQGSDTGDYVVRNLLGIDSNNRRLVIGDVVRPGQPLLFCRRDGPSAWRDLDRMLDDVSARTGGAAPKGALYFSCLGRGRHLFGHDSAEVRAIQRKLDGVPLVGFFANGEIARDRLYGYTGVLALFT